MTPSARKTPPKRLIFLTRLPFRLIIALRAGVFAGALMGLGAGLKVVLQQEYLFLDYWNSVSIVMIQEMLFHLVLVVVFGFLAAILMTFYDTMTRDPDRSAFLLVTVISMMLSGYLVLDIFLKLGGQGSASHLFRILRAAVENAEPGRLISRGILGMAVLYLLGQGVNIVAKWTGRSPALQRYPKYYLTIRAARLLAWFAGARQLTAAAILVVIIGASGMVMSRRDVKPGPDVILISVDTLRADHLGAYGYQRPTSPNIDSLAQNAVLFENAYSQAPWTLPSHATMFTSLRPSVHRADTYNSRLSPHLLTLAEILRERGYMTMGLSSHLLLSNLYGMEQGFTTFRFNGERPAKLITNKALKWIDDRRKDRPFFLFLHYFDVHADYDPPEDYRSQFVDPAYPGETTGERRNFYKTATSQQDRQHLIDLYDAEIAYTDHHLGRFFDGLKERKLYQEAMIILVSDHGEEFGEHGHFEHKTLYENILHVPLIIKPPAQTDRPGVRLASPARMLDLSPTILALTGIPSTHREGVPPAMQGVDLSLLLEGSEAANPELVFAEQHREVDPEHTFRYSLRSGSLKYIRSEKGDNELFDLAGDPAEKSDIINLKSLLADDMLGRLRAIQDENLSLSERLFGTHPADRDRIDLDKDTKQRLRALGYVTE